MNNAASWHSGVITADETWTADAVNVVDGTLTVATGATLTIQPGAIVKFVQDAHSQIVLQDGATLNAPATQALPIIFTSWADDSAGGDTNLDGSQSQPEPGDWSGFTAAAGANLNLSALVDIRYVLQRRSGTLSANETWLGSCVEEVTGNIVVLSGVTLTILPGAIVKFDAGLGIVVEAGGQLIADGTAALPIIFTSIKDDSFGGDANGDGALTTPAAGDWGQIWNEGTTTLVHTEVLYGSGNGNTGTNGGAVHNDAAGTLNFSDSIISQALYDGLETVGHGGAVTNIANSIFIGCDRAVVVTYSESTVSIVNSTFDDNLIGIYAHANGSFTAMNCIVSNSRQYGVARDYGPQVISYCDVWTTYPGAHNYGGIADQTGMNGNISADPNYVNVAQGDYRLNYLSPAIDAGDGTVAPATDTMGDPRYSDPRTTTKTGVSDADGNYPDMGAYEFVETAPSNVDLVVSSVWGPASAKVGDTVTVSWTVTNTGAGTAVGPWHDYVMLVQDPYGVPVYMPMGVVLAASGVALGPGQSVTFSSRLVVPACAAGDAYFAVNPNCLGEVFEGQNAGTAWRCLGPGGDEHDGAADRRARRFGEVHRGRGLPMLPGHPCSRPDDPHQPHRLGR